MNLKEMSAYGEAMDEFKAKTEKSCLGVGWVGFWSRGSGGDWNKGEEKLEDMRQNRGELEREWTNLWDIAGKRKVLGRKGGRFA